MDRRAFASGAAGVALLSTLPVGASAQRTGPAQTGPAPTTAGLRVRRNVQSMAPGDPFFARYGAAVQRMHALPATDRRSWRQQALIHLNNCPHGRDDFFHWHRHYITQFERICAEMSGDPTFALPYWDWTSNQGRIPDPFYDVSFLNVAHWRDPSNASSPNWFGGAQVTTVGARGLARGRGLLDDPVDGGSFTPDAIAGVLALTDYALFWPGIEGSPHGNAHVIVGTTASGPAGHIAEGLSPLDPIFWLHHCNVDRLWEEWRSAGNTTPSINQTYANQFVDARGTAVTVRSADALDAARLGFTYESLAVAALTPGPVGRQPAIVRRSIETARGFAGIGRLGRATTVPVAPVGAPTAVPMTITGLSGALQPRPARGAPTNNAAPEDTPAAPPQQGGRVVLKLTGVKIDKDNHKVLVNVFVNCPYLTPTTPYTDRHYAGTFALFGHGGGHAGHGGGQGTTIVIDATRCLRGLLADGRIAADGQLQVQLMAVAASRGTSDARVTVGGIEARRG